MYSPSLFVWRQRALMSSSLRPGVDAALELVQAEPAVDAGSRRPSMSRLTPFRTRTCIREIYAIPLELATSSREPRLDVRAVVAEQHEVDRVAASASCRAAAPARRARGRPRPAAGRAPRSTGAGSRPGQPQRGEQAERDRLAVRQVEVGRRLERVRERVAEVEPRARPAVVRVPQAERRLVRGGAAHVERCGRRAAAS